LIGIVLVGTLIRLLFMPFTMAVDPRFTGDVTAYVWAVQEWIARETTSFSFLYAPLTYSTFSGWLGIVEPLTRFPDLSIFGKSAQFEWLAFPYVFRNLFLFKMLYLLPDLGSAIVLWKMLRAKPSRARLAILAWVFNPLVIYTAYIHGQADLIPVFFVWLGLLAAAKKRSAWAAFWIGISACFKFYALIFLPPLAIILARTRWERAKLLLAGALPFVLLCVPYAGSYPQLDQLLLSHRFVVGYDLGYGAQVYVLFAAYGFLLWYLHHHRASTIRDLWQSCLAILLIYYQISHFDVHYWTWAVPFAMLLWLERPAQARPFLLSISAGLLFLTAPLAVARFLAPISPRFFLRLPSLMEALNPYLPMLFIVNVVRSLMAGTCLYLAWRLLRDIAASRDDLPRPPAGPATATG
jgi:hypothetical protein